MSPPQPARLCLTGPAGLCRPPSNLRARRLMAGARGAEQQRRFAHRWARCQAQRTTEDDSRYHYAYAPLCYERGVYFEALIPALRLRKSRRLLATFYLLMPIIAGAIFAGADCRALQMFDAAHSSPCRRIAMVRKSAR